MKAEAQLHQNVVSFYLKFFIKAGVKDTKIYDKLIKVIHFSISQLLGYKQTYERSKTSICYRVHKTDDHY
jgi:hypothetical protein